jgi:hypothetical protein
MHGHEHRHSEKAEAGIPLLKLSSILIKIHMNVLALEPEKRAIRWSSIQWEATVRRMKIILTDVTSSTRNTVKLTFQHTRLLLLLKHESAGGGADQQENL